MAEASPLAVDFNKIIEQFAVTQKAQAEQDATLRQQEGQLNTSVDAEIRAINSEANLQGEIEALVQEVILKRAGRNAQAAAEFGTNQDASTYVIGELAKTSRENTIKIAASAQNLEEIMAVGPTDNLLEWMVNQFSLPSQVRSHNALVAQQDIVDTAISRLQTQTQEQFKINNQIDAATSKDIIALNQKKLLAAATIKAENARQKALATNMSVGSVRLATNQQAFTNTLSLVRAQIDLQQLQIQQMRQRDEDELRKLQLEKLRAEIASDVALGVALERATAVHGMRAVTPQQFRNMQGPMRNALEYAMSDPNTEQGRLASSPSAAVEIAEAMNSPLTPATQDIKKKLIEIMTAAQTPEWSTLKPEQKRVRYNKAIDDALMKDMRNVPDTGSIFSAPPLNAVGKIPAVQATQLWSQYLAKPAENAFAPTSANQIFKFALDAVKENKMTIENASAQVGHIYRAIVADNAYNRDYGRFGIVIPEPYRQSYRTRIDGPFRFGSDQAVDMTNDTAVRNMMLRHLNALRAESEEIRLEP